MFGGKRSRQFDGLFLFHDGQLISGIKYDASFSFPRRTSLISTEVASATHSFNSTWDRLGPTSDSSPNNAQENLPEPGESKSSPLFIALRDNRFSATFESIAGANQSSRLTEAHIQVASAAAKAQRLIGSNHPGINSMLADYIQTIGQEIEALRPAGLFNAEIA
jgi:hypothetical protein